MRGRSLRPDVRWLTLLTAVLVAAWILLSTGGSAHADEPQDDPGQAGLGQTVQPLVQPLGAPLEQAVSSTSSTVGTTMDQVTQTLLPSLEVPRLAVDLATATSPITAGSAPAEPAAEPHSATYGTATPADAALQPAAQVVGAAVTSTLHSGSSPLAAVSTSLSSATTTLTTTLATTVHAAADAVPAALPLTQLQDTLASLAGSVDQLTAPTSSTVNQALAPVQQLFAARPAPAADGQAAAAAHTDAPAAAATPLPASGSHGPTTLTLPVLFPKTGSGTMLAHTAAALPTSVQSAVAGLAARAAAHVLPSAPAAPDLGSLLAPGDGVPPSAPATQHTPPSPAPSGPDGSGHAHFALGIGALPTLLPVRETTHSASSRLPLSPTFLPGESPD